MPYTCFAISFAQVLTGTRQNKRSDTTIPTCAQSYSASWFACFRRLALTTLVPAIFTIKEELMESIILDGKAVSAKLESELKVRVENIVAKSGITPVLATILVGEDPSSKVYVNMKGNACKRIGLTPRKVLLPETTTTEELKNAIYQLNEDKDVFGILLQHPVPRQINERECFDAIDPAKDVDGVTATGFGMMALGEKVFVSATPGGILYLLKQYNIPLAGKRAIVI